MDTLFETKKADKSSMGHTYYQPFVTAKVFVYVVPMKSNDEVLQYIKHFSKDVGKPEPIISDSAR